VQEILNLQPRGPLAKPYQVKQVRKVLIRYKGKRLNDEVRDHSLLERRGPAFVAEVPELAGCAADGSTRQEALANVETVIAEWLETANALGRPIPEPKGRVLSA
jgi:predicted RNase H-like HicB family nuclease